MGHGAQPSRPAAARHDSCLAAGCGVVPRLVPGPDEGGGRKQNAVVVIVVHRYARLAMVARLGSLSFLCGYVDDWLFVAIIDRSGYMLLPLKKRHYAIFLGLKISNLFW